MHCNNSFPDDSSISLSLHLIEVYCTELALQCTVRMGGSDWLGLLRAGRKISARVSRIARRPQPFSLSHSHSCTQLMPSYWKVKCFNSRIYTRDNTRGSTRFTIGAEMHHWRLLQLISARDLFSYMQASTSMSMSALTVRMMLMKPFLGKTNRQAKAVSPPTHRPFVQTDSSHHLGWVSELFWPVFTPPPTFLCLEPMFAPRA